MTAVHKSEQIFIEGGKSEEDSQIFSLYEHERSLKEPRENKMKKYYSDYSELQHEKKVKRRKLAFGPLQWEAREQKKKEVMVIDTEPKDRTDDSR